MKSTKNIGIGLICMGTGLIGLTLDIDIDFHYIGPGSLFGVGASLLGSALSDTINQTEEDVA